MVALLLLVSFTAPRWSRWLETGAAPALGEVVDAPTSPTAGTRADPGGRINVELFFQARDHSSLVGEARAVPFSPALYRQVELVLEELIRGPEDPALLATLPASTRLGDVFVLDGGIAVVTLTLPPRPTPAPELEEGTGPEAPPEEAEALDPVALELRGSKEELLSVYSIVNTVTVNLPAVRRVRLLAEPPQGGLGDHVELRHPLPPDMTLLLPPEEWQLVGAREPDALADGEGADAEGGSQ